MSLTAVRQYFRDRMGALDFIEHPDGFNIENLPAVSIDRAFHILNGPTSPLAPITHRTLDVNTPITLRLFFRGFRDPVVGIETAIEEGEQALCSILASANRLGSSVKNVNFVSFVPEPIAGSNDNDIILVMEFTARTILEI